MSTQILLTVSDDVYSQAKTLAVKTQRDVADVLLETINQSFSPFPVDPNRETMNLNVQAYHALHSELVRKYEGQYVAIHKGQLVDHDPDPIVLLQRVRAQFPNETVLRRKVEAHPEREIRMRHPRIYPQP